MKPTLSPNTVLAAAQVCWEGLLRPALRGRIDQDEARTGRRPPPGAYLVIFGLACVVGPSLGIPMDSGVLERGEAVVVILERVFGPIALLGDELGTEVSSLLDEYPSEGLPILYVHRDGDVGLVCIHAIDMGEAGQQINARSQGGSA